MYPNAKYQRLHNEEQVYTKLSWLRVKFRNFTLTTCSLPFFAFVFCVVYSLIRNFKQSTYTSCASYRDAYNVLPSISAAIGGFSPQKEIWQTAILLDFLPRIALIFIYTKYNRDIYQEYNNILVYVLALLNTIENCALLLLSYYDSTHYYSIHEVSFITFVVISELHMLLLIFHKSQKKITDKTERYGLKLKKILAATNISSILLAMYYFVDHNQNCEDFAYTKFAFFEYVVVLSNIAFHYTIVYDFPYQFMIISPNELIKLEDIRISHRSLIMQAHNGIWRKVKNVKAT